MVIGFKGFVSSKATVITKVLGLRPRICFYLQELLHAKKRRKEQQSSVLENYNARYKMLPRTMQITKNQSDTEVPVPTQNTFHTAERREGNTLRTQ